MRRDPPRCKADLFEARLLPGKEWCRGRGDVRGLRGVGGRLASVVGVVVRRSGAGGLDRGGGGVLIRGRGGLGLGGGGGVDVGGGGGGFNIGGGGGFNIGGGGGFNIGGG